MKKGFTLVELLVVIGISAAVSAIAIVYTAQSRNNVALSVETAKVSQFILRAKDLSLAAYNDSPGTCAYGVSFSIANNTYSIFKYTPQNHPPEHVAAPPCPTDAFANVSPINADELSEYSQDTWNVHVANGVKLVSGGAGDDATVVLFYPPAPTVWISRDGANFLDPTKPAPVTSNVYLSTADGRTTSTISVNGAGQVSI